MNIRIIGHGRLAKSLMQKWQHQHQITVSSPSLTTHQQNNIRYTSDNTAHLSQQDCIILAVKPVLITKILSEILQHLPDHATIISLAAGITLETMQTLLPPNMTVMRAMPNIAAEIGQSATVMLPSSSQPHHRSIEQLFQELGKVYWVEQDDILDVATILSGSGPAYVFYFMQVLQEAATQLGMPEELSKALVQQTFLGASNLSLAKNVSLAELQAQVVSPQGTTAAAISVFEDNRMSQTVMRALTQAWQKITNIRGRR